MKNRLWKIYTDPRRSHRKRKNATNNIIQPNYWCYLAKIWYFTKLDYPEMRGFSHFEKFRSCEVAKKNWRNVIHLLPKESTPWFSSKKTCSPSKGLLQELRVTCKSPSFFTSTWTNWTKSEGLDLTRDRSNLNKASDAGKKHILYTYIYVCIIYWYNPWWFQPIWENNRQIGSLPQVELQKLLDSNN